jgi:7,8-dihydropterin-6-yl-methyl-4-(beta-D-ribofuranosyl)aminobenzene 5'-phosphate synthase
MIGNICRKQNRTDTIMKVFILAENQPGPITPAEHGLSYLIEADGKKILFDTGQSDIFLRNAAAMDVSLNGIDVIVLSHGHFDHGNGLEHLHGSRLICHPGCFVKRYRAADNSYIGLKNTRGELENKFDLITSATPYMLSEKITFLGEIPRITSFESRSTSFTYEDGTPDYVTDDSSLAIILPQGLFVITGCGHAGIVNTLMHAAKVTGIEKIHGIMGGFHLKENDLQTKKTISYLKKNKIRYVLPSHCTAGTALDEFQKIFGSATVKTGDIFEF